MALRAARSRPSPKRRAAERAAIVESAIARALIGRLEKRNPYFERYDWRVHARPEQIMPDGDWYSWILMAGRGFGKNRTGAEGVRELVRHNPGSHGALVARTAADVRDTMLGNPGSGLMQVFPPSERPLWEPSKRRVTFPNGAYATTYSADEPESLRGPQHAWAWGDEVSCLIPGTLVQTARGSIPIERVTTADRVWTRYGLRRVRWAGLSSPAAVVWRLSLSNGTTIVGTDRHPFYVVGRGWVPLASLLHGDTLVAWTGRSGAAGSGTETLGMATTEIGGGCSCTAPCGRPSEALSPTGGRCTTETEIAATTPSTTSRRSRPEITSAATAREDGPRGARSAPHPAVARNGSGDNLDCGPARSAVVSTSRPASGRDSVRAPASNAISVVGVERLTLRMPVYDLSVEGAHEFYAGGVLVHNTWRYPHALDMLRMGLRLPLVWPTPTPRLIVTMTPRTTKAVKELLNPSPEVEALGRTIITRGTTLDNAANLAPLVVAQLYARYARTRLERQELGGELIEDVEGALFRREQLEATRVRWWTGNREDGGRLCPGDHDSPVEVAECGAPVHLERAVVTVDPGGSAADNDPTAIAVVGLGDDGDWYIIEAVALRVSPEEWAKRAIWNLDRWNANYVVGETNHGGEMVASTLRAQRPASPFKGIHAKKGKALRAEPVSLLADQGRVHMVGYIEVAEEQLVAFTGYNVDDGDPTGGHFDVVDAIVYGVLELGEGTIHRGAVYPA